MRIIMLYFLVISLIGCKSETQIEAEKSLVLATQQTQITLKRMEFDHIRDMAMGAGLHAKQMAELAHRNTTELMEAARNHTKQMKQQLYDFLGNHILPLIEFSIIALCLIYVYRRAVHLAERIIEVREKEILLYRQNQRIFEGKATRIFQPERLNYERRNGTD